MGQRNNDHPPTGKRRRAAAGREVSRPAQRPSQLPADENGPLERYFAVLELIAAFPNMLTMSDISTLMSYPRTTTHRLLSGLKRAGLIDGGGRNQPFSLSERTLRLVPSVSPHRWISTVALPHLQALATEHDQASYIVRRVGHRVLVVAGEIPDGPWANFVWPGSELPPHAAATAKAVLAFQTPETIQMALSGPLARLTPQTCTRRAYVLKEYETIRRDGYALCVSEINETTGAIGVPIPQANGSILHGIGVTGPLRRIINDDLPALIESLHKTAAALSDAISLGVVISERNTE